MKTSWPLLYYIRTLYYICTVIFRNVASETATPSSFSQRWRSLAVNVSLLILSLLVFAAVVEIGLRLTGFSYVLYPQEIEFGKPDPVLLEIGFLEDDELFWVTKGYPETLELLRASRPALLFMGDSCTHLGRYDEALERLVSARTGAALSSGNLGVAGWSTYQGRRQLERDVVPLEPSVVTVYYGWNDHWIGFGIEDKNVALVKRVFSGPWSGSRLVQLATKATVALGTRKTAYPNRVSPTDFEDNLRAIVRGARSADIHPVLVTAATSHREGEEPEHLGQRWLRDLSELVPLHQGYVDTVRRVAAEEGAILCDAAGRFAALPREEVEESFMKDGIHLTVAGDERLAGMLYECLENEGLLELVIRPR